MGWTVPSVVDEAGALIAGHGRVLAAKKLKLKEVPLVVARGWSEAQKAAYVLADNKLALNADWDTDVLQAEIGSLESMGFDLALTGFTLTDLESGAKRCTIRLARTRPTQIGDTLRLVGPLWAGRGKLAAQPAHGGLRGRQ